MDPATHKQWMSKFRVLIIAVAILFSVLLVRLFHLQVRTFADYAKESEDNRIHQKRVTAPRGRILDRDGRVLSRNRASYTVSLISSTPQRNAETIAALESALGDVIPLSASRERFKRLKRDVDFETVCIVEERLMDDWPLAIAIEPQRQYPHGPVASHLLGYMGQLPPTDIDKLSSGRYVSGDYVGRSGVERVFEDTLRGWDGVRYVEMDAKLRIIDEFPFPERERVPTPGRDLLLTLDLDLQRAAEAALPKTRAGSVVALDPRDGAVLAMASRPTFDPNVFVSFQSQQDRLRLMSSDDDLLNRSLQGQYPPGSTLKLVASVAALEAGITDTMSTFPPCAGSLRVGDTVFRCFNRQGHGALNLLEATATSCNIYFYHLAQHLGMKAWYATASKLGFGAATGFHEEFMERTGLLPSRQYYVENEGWWAAGHLLNLVIGQGAFLATPLQMARYVAALANGGNLVTPHVHGSAPRPERIEGISRSTLNIVKESMRRVVYSSNGTGKRLRLDGLEVAGKSGTAQAPGRGDDAWFIAFAPFEKPEIAVAVIVEGGGGGGAVAAPVARAVFEACFEDRLAGAGPRPVPEAGGNRRRPGT